MFINGVHYSTEDGLKKLEEATKAKMQQVIDLARNINIDEDLARKYGLTLEQIKKDPSIVDSPRVQEQLRKEEEQKQARLRAESANYNNTNDFYSNNNTASVVDASFHYGASKLSSYVSSLCGPSPDEKAYDVDEIIYINDPSYYDEDYDTINDSFYNYENQESIEGENMFYADGTMPSSIEATVEEATEDLDLDDVTINGVPGSMAFMNMFPGCFNSTPEGLAKLAEDIEKAKRCVKVVAHDPNNVNNNTSTSQVPNGSANAYPYTDYGYAPNYNNNGVNNTIMFTPNNFYAYGQPMNPMNGYGYDPNMMNYNNGNTYNPNFVGYNNNGYASGPFVPYGQPMQPNNMMNYNNGYGYNPNFMNYNIGCACGPFVPYGGQPMQPIMPNNNMMNYNGCTCGQCVPYGQPIHNHIKYTLEIPDEDSVNVPYIQSVNMFCSFMKYRDRILDGTKPINIAFKEYCEDYLDHTQDSLGIVIPENLYYILDNEMYKRYGNRPIPAGMTAQEALGQASASIGDFLFNYINSIPLEVDYTRAQEALRKYHANDYDQCSIPQPTNPAQMNCMTSVQPNGNDNRRLVGGPHPITGRMPDGYLTPEEIEKINASNRVEATSQNNIPQQPTQPAVNNNINNIPQQQPVQNPVMNPAQPAANNNTNTNKASRTITLDGPVRYINGIPIEEFEAGKDLKLHSTMYTPKEEEREREVMRQQQAQMGYAMQQPMVPYPPVNPMPVQQAYAIMPVTSLRTGRICIDPNPHNPYATSPIYQAIMSRAPVVNLDPTRTPPPNNYVFSPVAQMPPQAYQNAYMYNNAYGRPVSTYINPQAAEAAFKNRLEIEKLKYKMVAKYMGWEYDDEKVDKMINPRNPVNLPTEQERMEIAHWNEIQRIVYYSQHQDLVPLAPHQVTARFMQEKIKNFHKELDGHTMCEFFEEDYPRLMREFWLSENVATKDNRNHNNTYDGARYNALLQIHQRTNPYIQKILSQTPPPEKGEEVRVVPNMDFMKAVINNNPEADPKAIYAVYQNLMKSQKMQDYCDEFVDTLEGMVQDRCTIKGLQNRAIQEKQAQAAANNN